MKSSYQLQLRNWMISINYQLGLMQITKNWIVLQEIQEDKLLAL